ncbi:MAG: heparinase II/III family protein [bacterium]
MGRNPETLILVSVGLIFALFVPTALAEKPALIDHLWREDFENGTISGWSSYPPFEDTAYDYTILCGHYREPTSLLGYVASGEFLYPLGLGPPSMPEGNRFYCLRAYRPNSLSPQRIGFAHKFSLYTAEDSTLSFHYWLKLTTSGANLLVELAGADGKRYRYIIADVPRERWESVDIRLSSFRSEDVAPPPGLQIQAVAIVAQLEHGDPAVMHYFAIDNVYLNCQKQAGFHILKPETFSYEHWDLDFCHRHFHPGDSLDIEVLPDLPVKQITGRLEDFEGRAIAEDLKFIKQNNQWRTKTPYRFSDSDSRGPMKLILEGKTHADEFVRTDVRLWFLDRPIPHAHPRLFFGESDLKELAERTQRGRYKPIWENIVRQAKNARSTVIPEDSQIQHFHSDYMIAAFRSYFSVLRSNAVHVFQNALVYAIDRDEEAGQFAKDGLLKMANWRQWVHPWFLTQGRKSYYPVGITAMELGMAYDLIYSLLSEDERAAVRQGILRNGIANSWQEYFVDNRMPNNTSNWISHCTAGPLTALLAFYGELAEHDIDSNGEPYFSGLAEKFLTHIRATLKSDGGYGEGYGYQNFTMSTAWPALAALEKVLGVSDLSRHLYFDRAYLYPLYISHNNWRSLLDMGDSGGSRSNSTNWAWFVHHHRDPLLEWFYDLAPGNDFADFLYIDDTIPSKPADTLPPSRVFPDKGNVVLRTGWTDDDLIFNFRAGPNYNHTHIDQGSFRLWGYGEDLVSEAGPGGYYTDPYYWSFVIQPVGHNTILIDENPESQEIGDFNNEVIAFNNHARLENTFLSEPVSIIRAELGMLYRGMLERLTRSVYFVNSRFFIFHDVIRSMSGPHRYQWQLFPPGKEGLTILDNAALYEGENARLQVNVVSPEAAVLKIKDTPISIYEYEKFPATPLKPRAVLQVTHDEPVNDQDFLVVLTPGRVGEAGPGSIEALSEQGWKAVRIVSGERTDTVYFSLNGGIEGELATDGISACVSCVENRVVSAAAETATSLKVDGETLFSAENSVTISLDRDAAGELWTIQSEGPTTVYVRPYGSGKATMTGDGTLKGSRGDFCVIKMQAGRSLLRLNY